MPRAEITDMLLEVDRWTDFAHLQGEAKVPEQTLPLTATLADALNLGLEKMADTCAGTSAAKLA
jgi:Tn3 transposase DDE domain